MNITVILGLIILLVVCGIAGFEWGKKDKEAKIANIKEWLKYAVIEAEKALGGGTGQLKLRYVYDLAVAQFPWLVSIVSFEVFSSWVDEALDWMKQQLETNKNIEGYVINKE